MVKTRIAGAAAIVTFGFATLGGAVVAVAAPANAAPAAGSTSISFPADSPSDSGGQAHLDPRFSRTPTSLISDVGTEASHFGRAPGRR
jgi:hypothetical protein